MCALVYEEKWLCFLLHVDEKSFLQMLNVSWKNVRRLIKECDEFMLLDFFCHIVGCMVESAWNCEEKRKCCMLI